MNVSNKISVSQSGWIEGVAFAPGDRGDYLIVWNSAESGDAAALVPSVYLMSAGEDDQRPGVLYQRVSGTHWIVIHISVRYPGAKLTYVCGGEVVIPCGVRHAADPLIRSACMELADILSYPETRRVFADPELITERQQ